MKQRQEDNLPPKQEPKQAVERAVEQEVGQALEEARKQGQSLERVLEEVRKQGQSLEQVLEQERNREQEWERVRAFVEGDWTPGQKEKFAELVGTTVLERSGLSYERITPFDESKWTQERKEFVRTVDMAMQLRSRREFQNASTFHAVYLIYKFFVGAQKEMRIFSGQLRSHAPGGSPDAGMPIYADEHVINAASVFLADEGTSLKIVVQNAELLGDIECHPLVQRLAELSKANELKGSCEIVHLDKAEVNGKPLPQHMIIMDREAYRLETDDKSAEAVVNCNDKAGAKKLIKVFNSLWDISKPLWSPSAAK